MDQLALLGGSRVRNQPFPARRTMGPAEKAAALEVLDSDVLSAFLGGPGSYFLGGPKVRAFERAWAQRVGAKHAISVNSWTAGLQIAIGAVGIQPGDEVVVSPYTMSASATCALFYGGIPVFADIDPDTFCLDPASIERCLTARTKAIVVVHLFGRAADMDAINAIARAHGVAVIEDAAQAPLATYKGRPVGTLGDVGGFSLNFHKHVHTGEGGMLVTNDDELAHRCQLIRNHGENAIDADPSYPLERPLNAIGGNYRLTELQSAIGLAQLERLGGYLELRGRLAARLGARLERVAGLTPPASDASSLHAYYVFPMRFDAAAAGVPRSLFVRAVNAELPAPDGFESTPLVEAYVKPLYLSRLYQEGPGAPHPFPFDRAAPGALDYHRGRCPVAERMYEREFLLSPLVREPLTEADIDDFASAIEKVSCAATRLLEASHELGESVTLSPLAAVEKSSVR